MDIPESITARRMYDELVEAMAGKERCYLLLDEIQEIVDWEKVVNSLLEGADADIYVTGSNAKLMPREISACLAGRYVSIPVYTLSFREYLDFKADSNLSGRALLEEYIRFGGFPIATLHRYDTQSTYQIVNGIYHTVFSFNIVKRHRIGRQERFDRVVKCIIKECRQYLLRQFNRYISEELAPRGFDGERPQLFMLAGAGVYPLSLRAV